MPQLFADAARAELAAPLLVGDMSFTIVEGGALFPVANALPAMPLPPLAGAVRDTAPVGWFKLVIQDDNGIEVVSVRTHAAGSNTFSDIARGQDGTTAREFAAGAVVGLRLTADDMKYLMEQKLSKDGNLAGLANPATARTNLGLGNGATYAVLVSTSPTEPGTPWPNGNLLMLQVDA